MSEEFGFTRGPARRPKATVSDPLLQWAGGLETKTRALYAGWFTEVNVNAELDEACQRTGFHNVQIKHQRTGAPAEIKTHWAIPVANIFVICDGVQTILEMAETKERNGIAFWWKQNGDRPESHLRARVYLRELLEVGFDRPFTLTAKSNLTGDIITAMLRQYDVLASYNAHRKMAGKGEIDLPFYAFSIPLKPSEKDVTRGNKNGGQTKEVTPPVADIPSMITPKYFDQHIIKKPWTSIIEAQVDRTIEWSVQLSEKYNEKPLQTQLATEEEMPD